jgi:hypothetical protein
MNAGRVSGGTFGRTGKTAGNITYGAFKARRAVGQVGHAAGRAINSNTGRTILTGAATIGTSAIMTRRNSNAARRAGYSEAQIARAKDRANRQGRGALRIMAGSYLAHGGAQVIGRARSRNLNIASAAMIGGGLGLVASGTRAHNKAVNRTLAKSKPAGNPRGAAMNRQASAKHKGRTMTRSQAARVAALARWGRRR